MSNGRLPVYKADGTLAGYLQTFVNPVGGEDVHAEAVTLVNPSDPAKLPGINDPLLVALQPTTKALVQAGGSLTAAGTVELVGQCVGGRIFANGVDSTFTINGGVAHRARAGTGFDLNLYFRGEPVLNNPVIAWASGSIDVSLFCLQ